MNMRKLLHRTAMAVLSAVIMMGVSPATAQELSPEQMDLARRYVELTDNAQVFEVTVVTTGLNTMRVLLGQNPELEKQLDEAIGKTIEKYRARKGELIDQFARIYAARFTVEELTEIVAFYESDVGQKLSQQNLEANQQLSTVLKIYESNLQREFLASVRATLKEMGIDI